MEFSEIKQIISNAAKKAGVSEYDVYYSVASNVSIETLKNEVSGFSSSDAMGIGFRCIVDGKFGQASCEYITAEELENLVFKAAENAKYIESEDEAIIFAGSTKYAEAPIESFEMTPASELKDIALSLQKKTYEQSELVVDGTQCSVSTNSVQVYMFNSYGVELQKTAGFVHYSSCPVVSNGEDSEDGWESKTVKNFDNIDEVAKNAIKTAGAKLGADTVESGKYNVVISGRSFSDLLGEFCSCFSAKQVKLGLSRLAGKVGEKIAADIITITDDPISDELCGKNVFDGEGVATSKKNVIENGVLKTLFYDLAMAKHFGVEPTGNASRGYASPVTISPYFLCVNKGEKSFETILGEAENGIYVTELKSFSASNAVTGDFSIESAGFLIENGKIGDFVKSFTIAGNFFDILKNVEALSDRLHVEPAGAFRGFASPDILVKNISIAGK